MHWKHVLLGQLAEHLKENRFNPMALQTAFGKGGSWRRPGFTAHVEIYEMAPNEKPLASPEVWVVLDQLWAVGVPFEPHRNFTNRVIRTLNHAAGRRP